MKSHNEQDHISVISLKRTPDRLKEFFRRNASALEHWHVHVVDGVDGAQQKQVFEKSRLISRSVLQNWSPGAIGSALSHMLSWRLCIEVGKPMIVAEDDAVLATQLQKNLKTLLRGRGDEPHHFLLLGWNFDSLLQAELQPGLGLISLFEPAYPDEEQLMQLVNCRAERRICKLKHCFGLPAYRITPQAAKMLLHQLNPLISEKIIMGRGIPTNISETLDGALNNRYEDIGAEIVFPPLALALNNPHRSLTRKKKPMDFHG